jgi:hypothetical protein
MPEFGDLTCERFAACLSQTFSLERRGADPLRLELIQVDPKGEFDPERDKRQAFSLLFRGPAKPILPQAIYPLENAGLGRLEIFLVPLGPDAEGGARYEAVFS